MNNKFTIPLFLLVIVFLFYLGTTVNDPQSSLINGVLVLSQILSSITTVIAVVIAFKTYKNWLNQITHPELYRDDKAIMDKLNVIHYKCRDFSDCKGFRIEHIFYEYKIIIEEENHDVDSINFLNNEWNETMREQKKQINSLLIRKF
ncbi:hypothetical protein [Photobacterium leiognathi]|uniref:hypothetical protein n=1 Tax=Photobacterium leiognathi TaxID=553611 RepID=UPI0029823171|nr:hypothetical protein [Photobacterium leiognathi]